LANRGLNRIRFLMEYNVSKTLNGNILDENDLEYYSTDHADTDVYDIGRVSEKSKKVDEEEQTDESADDIGQDSDSDIAAETPKKKGKGGKTKTGVH